MIPYIVTVHGFRVQRFRVTGLFFYQILDKATSGSAGVTAMHQYLQIVRFLCLLHSELANQRFRPACAGVTADRFSVNPEPLNP